MALAWLPDETIFSFCSRYRLLSGHRLSAETALDLFGHSRLGTAHDFPCRIDRFAARFSGQLGEPDEIIRRHSILPFFLPFVSAERADTAVRTLRGDQMGSLKFALGLLTSGFRAAHPLKACPQCMQEDVNRYAVAPWRVSQQLPGAWYCARHRCALLVSRLKINQVQRFQFMLPAGAELIEWQEPGSVATVAENVPASKLASLVAELSMTPAGKHYAPPILAKVYADEMIRIGHRRRSGQLDQPAAAASFQNFCSDLRRLPDMAVLPTSYAEAQRWLARMVRSRSGIHPLRHAITIAWLFDDCTAFRERYAEDKDSKPLSTAADSGPRVRDISILRSEDHQRFLSMVASGTSVRVASQAVGITVQTGLAWAAQQAVPIHRRPSKLVPAVLNCIIESARAGQSKHEIEREFEISRPTLDRILRSVPGLVADWLAAQSARKLASYRQEWSILREEHSTLGRQQLRLILPEVYAWLYRNDRQWLTEHSPEQMGPTQGFSNISWDARDAALADKVRRAALDFSHNRPESRLLLRHLRERVHDLTPQMRNLDRLPLTLKAVKAATRAKPRREAAGLV